VVCVTRNKTDECLQTAGEEEGTREKLWGERRGF